MCSPSSFFLGNWLKVVITNNGLTRIEHLFFNECNRGLVYIKFIDSQSKVRIFTRKKQIAWCHKNIVFSGVITARLFCHPLEYETTKNDRWDYEDKALGLRWYSAP